MSMREKKDLSRKLTSHTLGEVLHELGVDDVDDDYESSDEEKEDYNVPIRAPTHHHHHKNPNAHSSPLIPTNIVSPSNYRQVSNLQSNSRPPSRTVSRPSSFTNGSNHQRQEVFHHKTVADVFDISKLSEEEQVSLTLKLSEQESKYGANMFDELRTYDPSEIRTLESYGYNFGQAVERIFNEHHDATQEVIHGSEDASLIVEVDGSFSNSGKFVSNTNASMKRVSSGITANHNDHSPHGPAGYLETLHKPNSLKTRRHSGIIHHIEEKLGHSLETPHHSDIIEHKSPEPMNQSMSKSFMENFHKPNALKDRRHSGILHVIETKHCESDETEHKADTSALTPDQQQRSFLESFHKPNALKDRKHSGVFHSQVELKKEDSFSHRPAAISRDNSLSGEVTFPTTSATPRSSQNHHTHEIADRRSSMRTPPPPDAIHHVNLLDRKQSGIRAYHNRQGSGTSDSMAGFAAAFESDKSRSERRKTGGTPTSDSRYDHNGFDNDTNVGNERKTPINLIDEMLDPSQLSEEEQLALSIKLSEQEAKYGTNMLEELKQIDPSEIETLESFGYDFGQAVEIIFKEHHDVTQEVVPSHNDGYTALPQDAASHIGSHPSSTKVENNPLRRRPSNTDLLASVEEVNSNSQTVPLSRKMSNPLMLNPLKIENDPYQQHHENRHHHHSSDHHNNHHHHHSSDHHNNHHHSGNHHHHHHNSGENHHHHSSHHKDHHSSHHNIKSPLSNGLLENPLQRRPSNADLMDFELQQESQGYVPKELQRYPSNSLLENPLRRRSSKTDLLDDIIDPHGYQTIPSPAVHHKHHSHHHNGGHDSDHHHPHTHHHHHNTNDIPYDLQSLTSTQTIEAVRHHDGHNDRHHHKSHHHHGQQHHHHSNHEDRAHYYSEEYGYIQESYQHQYSPPPSEKHHHGQHRSRSNSNPTHSEEVYAPYQQQQLHHQQEFQYSPPPPPSTSQIYHQQNYSSQAPYQQQQPAIDRRLSNSSHSFYEGDTSRNGRIPQMVPERSFSNGQYPQEDNFQHVPPHEYMDPQLYQQQQLPLHPSAKTLSHHPSVHNMVPVRVESYFDVPANYSSPSNYHSHIHGGGLNRSSSQELHRSHSQSMYDQPPNQHPAHRQSHGGMDNYSPHPSYQSSSITSYDSFDRSSSQQQYSPVPSVTPPTPYTQQSFQNSNGNSQHSHARSLRGSLSQPPRNIIEEMRSEALSRLSEDEQIRLSMLVSKQEEVHGMNMFDSLKGSDQPEIDYWMSLGYKFDKVALFMFQRRFDTRVTHPDR